MFNNKIWVNECDASSLTSFSRCFKKDSEELWWSVMVTPASYKTNHITFTGEVSKFWGRLAPTENIKAKCLKCHFLDSRNILRKYPEHKPGWGSVKLVPLQSPKSGNLMSRYEPLSSILFVRPNWPRTMSQATCYSGSRFNEPLYNDVLGITHDIHQPVL